ncbi:MAG TPA: hypothetical protein VGO47_00410, partial [Chlamydiales bacterium]|nr:hypothetical protein [Chlamydiales bacterium]
MITTCTSPRFVEIPPVDSHRLFEKAIDELSNAGVPCSKQYEDYSELQIALLIRDRSAIRRTAQEVGACEKIKENTPIPCMLAYLAGVIKDDEQTFALLFERAPPPEKAAILSCFMAVHHIAYFEQFWQASCPIAKAIFLVTWNKDPTFIDSLYQRANPPVQKETLAMALSLNKDPTLIDGWFQKANPQVQKETLETALFLKDEGLFRRLWQQANPTIHMSTEPSWLILAIQLECAPIVSFLLQAGVKIQVVQNGNTALEIAFEHRDTLGEAMIAQMAQLDQGFTQEMATCNLFGHAFDLKGEIFEGISRNKAQSVLGFVGYFLERQRTFYATIEDPLFSPEILETVLAAIQNPFVQIARVKDKWSLIRCGWKGHAVICIFSKDYCIKINTGAAAHAGIHFYRIGNQKEEDLHQAIRTLIQLHETSAPADAGSKYFNETLDQTLNLHLIGYLPYEQIGGHCAWYCVKAALLTLVILKQLEGQNITRESLEEVLVNAKFSFSQLWEGDCRTELANQAIPLLQKHQSLFDTKTIFTSMIETCIEERQIEPILRLIQMIPSYAAWRHPKTGRSILQLFLSKNGYLERDFFKLHQLGCDLSMQDHKRKSFYDDFQATPIDVSQYERMLKVYSTSPRQKDWLLQKFAHPAISRLFTEYRHPDSGKSLALLALESRSFHLAGLLNFLGHDLSTMVKEPALAIVSD